jgi:hypothetical protein
MMSSKHAYPKKVALLAALTVATAVIASRGWAPSVIQPLTPSSTRTSQSSPETLSDDERAVNFLRIEEAFAGIRDDAQSNNGPALLQALQASTADVPLDISSATMERMQFLIRRQLPGSLGDTIATRFESFYEYRRIEPMEIGSMPMIDDMARELEFLNQKVALRRKYFGNEEADWLFAEEHALAYYILALRKLDADSTLSDAERERQRTELQANYDAGRQSDIGDR